MKYRAGFVSNSSSTSFMIYGICLEGEELENVMEKYSSEIRKDNDSDEEIESYEFAEFLDEKGLRATSDYENDGIYIGLSWDEVKDDETGKQFKERVETLIATNLGKKFKCKTFSEVIYN